MLVPITAKIIAGLLKEGVLPTSPSVVEMGNQTYSIDSKSLYAAFELLPDETVKRYGIERSAVHTLSQKKAAQHPYDDGVPSAGEFYRAFGFTEYVSIDIEDSYGSIVMDLNKDLQAEYQYVNQFDLVTNIGVSEHLFNQATFFKNAHNLTKPGGYMLHILPSVGFINHSLFNYHPRFFDDLSIANKYVLHTLAFGERNQIHADLLHPSLKTRIYPEYSHFLAQNRGGSLLVVALIQKVHEAPFVTPIQGRYFEELPKQSVEGYRGGQGIQKPVFTEKGMYATVTHLSKMEKIRIRTAGYSIKRLRRLGRFLLENV